METLSGPAALVEEPGFELRASYSHLSLFILPCAAWERLSSWHWVGSTSGNCGGRRLTLGLGYECLLFWVTCDDSWCTSPPLYPRGGEEGSWAAGLSLLPGSSVGIEHRSGAELGTPLALRCLTSTGMGWVSSGSACFAVRVPLAFLWAEESVGHRSLTNGIWADCDLYMCFVWPVQCVCVFQT